MEGVPAARDYQGGFHAELMVKDLGLAAAAANECGAPLHMGRLAEQLYKQVAPHRPPYTQRSDKLHKCQLGGAAVKAGAAPHSPP